MNHIYYLLKEYLAQDAQEQWYCATVVDKSGSSYRWPGAMMLINPWGKTYGLVSGGCLESDVVRRAQRVGHMGEPEYVVYDTEEEDSFAETLGLGCNGKIGVLIQSIDERHRELLQMLYARMQQKQSSYLLQCYQSLHQGRTTDWMLLEPTGAVLYKTAPERELSEQDTLHLKAQLPEKQSTQLMGDSLWSVCKIRPPLTLWVLGGGHDAQALVALAATLGWLVCVVDHRAGYARAGNFPKAQNILHLRPEQAVEDPRIHQADAFVCMTHNKKIDAAWMQGLEHLQQAAYFALLGPKSRKDEIMALARVTPQFSQRVCGPAGLDIGGDLPESIALSILAECHAAIFGPRAIKPQSNQAPGCAEKIPVLQAS